VVNNSGQPREKTYRCIARGKTFHVREYLKSWGFDWDGENKTWHTGCVSEWQRRMFEENVSGGAWDGVVLEFEEEPREPWEDELDKMNEAFPSPEGGKEE